jgi:hypothetical protein
MIDETRQLRWYLGLGLLFLAAAPPLMITLVASDPEAPKGTAVPVFVGAPINLIGAVFVVRSMMAAEPAAAARLLKIGAALIIVGNVLLFAVRALAT